MKIHEYQAKAVCANSASPVPRGHAAFSVDEAAKSAQDLGSPRWSSSRRRSTPAVAARPAASRSSRASTSSASEAARRSSAPTLVTHQTGPEGKKVTACCVEQGCHIARELYLALVVDRESRRSSFMASTEGGMDIEEVAAQARPRRSSRSASIRRSALRRFQARQLALRRSASPASCRTQLSGLLDRALRGLHREGLSLARESTR